ASLRILQPVRHVSVTLKVTSVLESESSSPHFGSGADVTWGHLQPCSICPSVRKVAPCASHEYGLLVQLKNGRL
ncbi:hypothetical protein KUCAC02_037938, partial [Chaenocephalus aceratus]